MHARTVHTSAQAEVGLHLSQAWIGSSLTWGFCVSPMLLGKLLRTCRNHSQHVMYRLNQTLAVPAKADRSTQVMWLQLPRSDMHIEVAPPQRAQVVPVKCCCHGGEGFWPRVTTGCRLAQSRDLHNLPLLSHLAFVLGWERGPSHAARKLET